MFENWSYSRIREQELKALCYIYVERIDSCSPIVNGISELTFVPLSVSDTDSAQGQRYRSSEFVLMSTFCFLLN